MHIVVVMDEVGTILPQEDTTFGLMVEAEERGHRVDHCLAEDLYLEEGQAWAQTRRAHCNREGGPQGSPPVALDPPTDVDLREVDVVLIRKDPPFDSLYHYATLMLELLRGTTLVFNDPRGLRDANEKLYTTHFPELMPTTLVCRDKDRIKTFLHRIGGRGVIKPLDGAGGSGIFALTAGDPNLNAIIEAATSGGRELCMAQQYLPEVKEGDKRILLLEGEPLGAIMRVPQGGDLRSNIHVGGRVEAADLDDRDREIIAAVAPRLVADGLVFVGLDVIGGRLTEVNVTSPTGIQQMSRLMGQNLEARVIDWLEHQTV